MALRQSGPGSSFALDKRSVVTALLAVGFDAQREAGFNALPLVGIVALLVVMTNLLWLSLGSRASN